MPKSNKPRHADAPSIEGKAEDEAAAYLAGINLLTIQEVTHFPDGSMSIVHTLEGRTYHTGIEFNPPLTAAIARQLQARGIDIRRR